MKKIFAVLIAVMLLVTSFAGCSGGVDGSAVAYKVGEREFTVEDMNYMYVSAFNEIYYNLYSYYGSYLSAIIDISKPLDEQMLSEDKSWHDYLIECAESSVKNIVGVYEEAIANDFVLPEDYQNDIDTFDEQISEIAADNDMTVDEYIEASYGKNISLESVKKMTELQIYSNAYALDYKTKIEVTDDDIWAYYEANKTDIDTVNFRYYTSFYNDETDDSEETDETEVTLTEEEAMEQAKSLANVHTADEFNALAKEYTTDEEQKALFDESDATLFMGAGYSATGIDEVSEWLFDESREAGDTMIHHDEDYQSYLTIMFEERVDPDYNRVNVRHILITPEEDEDGNITDEAWAAAKEKAEEIYNSYLDGDRTEEIFHSLAVEYSADGNASDGGIYENVYKGQMVQTFNDWCFDEVRESGDTGIVKTPYGYHIMYFVGLGDNNLWANIESTVVTEKLSAFIADCSVNLTDEETDKMENVGGMIDELYAAANETDEDSEDSGISNTTIIIAALVLVIIVCVVIIIRGSIKNKKAAKAAEIEESEEVETSENEEIEDGVLETTDDDLTEEEICAEEAFENEETTEVEENSEDDSENTEE